MIALLALPLRLTPLSLFYSFVFKFIYINLNDVRDEEGGMKQPTTSSLLRQRRLRWFVHLHRMPSSLPVRRVFDFNPNIHGWKRPRGRPKTRYVPIQSSTTSTQLASTPPMPHRIRFRWSMTDPSGRPLFANCQRANPSMALKSSKSSQ